MTERIRRLIVAATLAAAPALATCRSAEAPPAQTGSYTIEVRQFGPPMPAAAQAAFDSAVAKWERIIPRALATVNLSIYSEARPAAEEFINWSIIGHGFVTAARVLVRAFFFILQALVVLIPLGVLGGGIAWGVVAALRARRKRRAP